MKRKNVNKLFPPTRLAALERRARRPGLADMVRAEAEGLIGMRAEIVEDMLADSEGVRLRERMRALTGTAEAEQLGWDAGASERLVRQYLGEKAQEILAEAVLESPGRFPLYEHAVRERAAGRRDRYDETTRLLLLVGHGEQAVRVFPDLAEALVRTRIRAPRAALQMPYPAFEILLPETIGRKWPVIGPDGTRYPSQSAVLMSCALPGPLSGSGAGLPALNLSLFGASPDGLDENVSTFSVPLLGLLYGDDDMIDERAVQKAVVRICRNEQPQKVWWSALRLAINLVLYMNAEEADVRRSARTRTEDEDDARARKKGRTPKIRRGPRVYDAGRRVKLPGIRQEGEGDGTGPKIRHRFWVRGHWRNQSCGPERSQTALKWIAPYEKGKGKGLPRLYGRQYEAEVGP